VMSLARITVVRLKETPKYLLIKGKDEEVVTMLTSLAKKYGRSCSLTITILKSCGEVQVVREERERAGRRREGSSSEFWKGLRELRGHFRGLFFDRQMGISTGLLWLSWALIGLAYPLYNVRFPHLTDSNNSDLFQVFLPEYLASRGATFGDGSVNKTYQDYAISNTIGIFGPMVAAFLCEVKYCGRRGTMVIGALATSMFQFHFRDHANRNSGISLCVYPGEK